ncbi:MAG: hypothetical protein FWD82_01370 [Defluviitaleaceae bacterium]|nr:hypothetical protein [Defluviitaleaceae bacterium]
MKQYRIGTTNNCAFLAVANRQLAMGTVTSKGEVCPFLGRDCFACLSSHTG